jgi:hypothetical protein
VDRETAFEAWAPRGSIWTPWVKPVLFAYMDEMAALSPPRPTWLHPGLLGDPGAISGYRTAARPVTPAIVVDLPDVGSVAVGLALADFGFRPVPLYAAVPSAQAVVPMWEVIRALLYGAQELPRKGLPPDAPPAFLLDARRDGGEALVRRGQYDNRSVAFVTDFPSAARLREAGTKTAVLIQSGDAPASADVASILAIWQATGLPIHLLRADAPTPAVPIRVRPPGLLARVARLLRGAPVPDPQGRFGRWIPELPRGG